MRMNIRIAEDLEHTVSWMSDSSSDSTYNTANATEAIDSDVGRHIGLA